MAALHLIGATDDGHLWHTIRHEDGRWDQFGDVEGQAGQRGAWVSVAVSPGFGGEVLHVVGATDDGHLWHTVRKSNGAWLPFGDVEDQARQKGNWVSVACGQSVYDNQLHILGATIDGRVWHTMRDHIDGSWRPFGDVEVQAGERGSFVSVSISEAVTDFPEGPAPLVQHVCGATNDGHLWHTIRHDDGSWDQFGDVEGQAGQRGSWTSASCALEEDLTSSTPLHLCGATNDGHLWHTIRRANGSWTSFGDVEGQAGHKGQWVSVSASHGGA